MQNRSTLLFSVLFPALVFASSNISTTTLRTPLVSKGSGPRFVVDYACFQGEAADTYVEFYIEVPFEELQFIRTNQGFRADYELQMQIIDGDRIVESSAKVDSAAVLSFEETVRPGQARVIQLSFTVAPRQYQIAAQVKDVETGERSHIEAPLVLKDFRGGELQLSDLQLSPKIETSDDFDASYLKNGRTIEPNPWRVFSGTLSEKLFLYFEATNLVMSHPKSRNQYTVVYSFYNADGALKGQLRRAYEKPGTSVAHSVAFPLEQFSPGKYVANIRLEDKSSASVAETSSAFEVVNPVAVLNASW